MTLVLPGALPNRKSDEPSPEAWTSAISGFATNTVEARPGTARDCPTLASKVIACSAACSGPAQNSTAASKGAARPNMALAIIISLSRGVTSLGGRAAHDFDRWRLPGGGRLGRLRSTPVSGRDIRSPGRFEGGCFFIRPEAAQRQGDA